MECFCGCGQQIPRRRRRANKQAAKVAKDLDGLRTVVIPRLEVEHANRKLDVLRRQADRLVEEGLVLSEHLDAYVHGDELVPPTRFAAYHREAGGLVDLLEEQARLKREGC